MTIHDYADAPFGSEPEWAGRVAKRKPHRVVIEDESQVDKEDPHHV